MAKNKKTDLNKKVFSENYLKVEKRGQTPLLLNDIYKEFNKYCKNNNINMVITNIQRQQKY